MVSLEGRKMSKELLIEMFLIDLKGVPPAKQTSAPIPIHPNFGVSPSCLSPLTTNVPRMPGPKLSLATSRFSRPKNLMTSTILTPPCLGWATSRVTREAYPSLPLKVSNLTTSPFLSAWIWTPSFIWSTGGLSASARECQKLCIVAPLVCIFPLSPLHVVEEPLPKYVYYTMVQLHGQARRNGSIAWNHISRYNPSMYTKNPHMPKIRRDAVRLVKHKEWSTREAARYTGYSQSVIVKWCKKDPTGGWHRIETRSSRPDGHPKMLKPDVVKAITDERHAHGRCAEVIHRTLLNKNISVSLSSVKRTLDRKGLTNKRSPWKRYHRHVDRPRAEKPGDLVQVDTIHIMRNNHWRMYVFVLLDVYSRWAYAKAYPVLSGALMTGFVQEAEARAGFRFSMIQSDHGPEFSKHFVARMGKHRFSRIGKPNDNSHVERFNRTLQEECLDRLSRNPVAINAGLGEYLKYYNTERIHMGINFKTPAQLIPSY